MSAESNTNNGGHRFIVLAPTHRSQQNAEDYVSGLFRKLDASVEIPKHGDLTLRPPTNDGSVFEVTFLAAVQEARTRGSAEAIRTFLNNPDRYFPFTMSVACDGEGMKQKLAFAGQELSMKSPFRQGVIEAELTDDILEHRRRVSEHSVGGAGEFTACAMHYRAYLLACCALVEAFLNRAIIIDRLSRSSPKLDELKQFRGRLDEKFTLWLDEFCGDPITAINGGGEWSAFQELSRRRNSLMHAADTMLGIELKDVARQLNLVQRGVGGLINLLRSKQQLPPVPFAERLETAPEARFVRRK